MAAVATVIERFLLSDNLRIHIADVAFDASYPAGGEAISSDEIDMNGVVYFQADLATAGGYAPGFDYVNKKLKLYESDNNNAADAKLIENVTADVSALTAVRCLIIGRHA